MVRQELQRRDRGPSAKARLIKKGGERSQSQRPFVKARSFCRRARLHCTGSRSNNRVTFRLLLWLSRHAYIR